jgi:hypothetical protein
MPLNTPHRYAPSAPAIIAKPGRKLQTARKDAGGDLTSPATPVPVTAAGKAAEAASSTLGSQGSGTAGGAGAASGGGAKPPFDWDDIALGSLVLAQADDEDAYYAAKVVATDLTGILDRASCEATAWSRPWVAGRPDSGS